MFEEAEEADGITVAAPLDGIEPAADEADEADEAPETEPEATATDDDTKGDA
jgi:hypothetical protein